MMEKTKQIRVWSCTWHNSKTNDAGEFLDYTKAAADRFAADRRREGADTVSVQPALWTPERSPPQV